MLVLPLHLAVVSSDKQRTFLASSKGNNAQLMPVLQQHLSTHVRQLLVYGRISTGMLTKV